jgi:hypothetical protein
LKATGAIHCNGVPEDAVVRVPRVCKVVLRDVVEKTHAVVVAMCVDVSGDRDV